MSQGSKANTNGSSLENMVYQYLENKGYQYVKDMKIDDQKIGLIKKLMYSKHYKIGNSIYNRPLYTDVIIYHPEKYPKFLAIEIKWQQSGGSVDEKYPYLVQNIKERFPCDALIILDGGGYKPGALEWLKNQTDMKLVNVFNLNEFIRWGNNGGV